jgi:hypothetical protein
MRVWKASEYQQARDFFVGGRCKNDTKQNKRKNKSPSPPKKKIIIIIKNNNNRFLSALSIYLRQL